MNPDDLDAQYDLAVELDDGRDERRERKKLVDPPPEETNEDA
jgi:hypothetical protein